jgi:PAS domain S-box-containing protein
MEHPPALPRENQRILVRYSIPFVAVAVAALFRLGLDPFLSWKAPLVFFILAILISARWGGIGPGLTATVISVLAGAYLFMEPRFSLRVADPANVVSLALFAFAGVVVSVIYGQLRVALHRSGQAASILQTFVERAPMRIVMLDRRMRVIQASQRWLDDIGMPREEMSGKSHYECFPNLPEAWIEAHRRGLAGESLSGHEERYVAPDGKERWVTWRIVPWGDAGETSGGIIIAGDDVTARIQAEAMARRNEMEYRALFENMSEGLAHCQMIVEDGKPLDFIYLSVNEAFKSLSGLGNVEGRRMSELAADNLNVEPEIMGVYVRVALTGEPEKLESYVKRSGQWFSISAYSPEPGYFVSILGLVTSRKKRELAALQWQRAFEQSDAGIILVDPANDTVEIANSAASRMLGYSPEELARRPVANLYSPHQLPRRVAMLRSIESGTGHALFESSLVRGDGNEFPALLDVTAVRDENGAVISRVDIIHDLTEKKRTERAVSERDETIRALLESASQAILAVDSDGKIALLNPMAGKMFGYGMGELLGRPLAILIPEEISGLHTADRAACFADPRVWPTGTEMKLSGVRRDGTQFPVEISLSFISTASADLSVAFVSDITQRTQMEEAARARTEEIGALATRLMTVQEEERRSVSRELHDGICQQLASLAIDIGVLANQSLPEDTLRSLTALQARAVEAAEVARNIAHELHPAMLDELGVAACLQNLCEEFSASQSIAVRFRHGALPRSVPRKVGACLFRVAEQSLQNIAQHSGATWVVVGLHCRHGHLLLSIRDDGVGFEQETVRGRGSLGLIGMEERARLVNGKLSISTERGRGTRIAIDVPLPAGSV